MSETLTWAGEELTGPIVCEDLAPLRAFMTRGGNLTMPGTQGTRPYAPMPDELDVSLVWVITGRVDPAGVLHADQEIGVELNQEHYRTLFCTGGDALTGEHEISLAYAGATYEGLAQLREYAAVRTGPSTYRLVTRLVVAAGSLELAGGSS